MRSEVISIVEKLAREHRSRFRASYVADEAGVSVDEARRDLLRLVQVGQLGINFELVSPFDDSTVAVYHDRARIPAVFESEDADIPEPFEVTEDLIWVTYSPTQMLIEEAGSEHPATGDVDAEDGSPPGNRLGPRWRKAARASTNSRRTRKAQAARR